MSENEEHRLIAQRREKLSELREKGNPYPNDFRRDAHAAELIGMYGGHNKDWLEKGSERNFVLSPDRRLLASQHRGLIDLRHTNSGDLKVRLQIGDDHRVYPQSICFAPDGRHIVSGNSDGTVSIWSLRSGNMTHRFTTDMNQEVAPMAVSPDGRYALGASGRFYDPETKQWTGSGDYAIRVWRLPKSVWRETDDSIPAESSVVAPVPTTDQEPADPQQKKERVGQESEKESNNDAPDQESD